MGRILSSECSLCNGKVGLSPVKLDGTKLDPPSHLISVAEVVMPIFIPQPIGFVASPFTDTAAIPKGLGAKHEAEGLLKILPAFEAGLTDIEGYSHLIVLWTFDRSEQLRSAGHAALRRSPPRRLLHPVAAPAQPDRPHRGRVAATRRRFAARPRSRHARRNPHPRHQALPFKHSRGEAAPRMAGRGRGSKRLRVRSWPKKEVKYSLARNLEGGLRVN